MSEPFFPQNYVLVAGTILTSIVVFLLLWKIYLKLSCGMCKSKATLEGKTVLITGCTAGIGRATVIDLACRGARIIMGCRNLDKANRLIEEIKMLSPNHNLVVYKLNLDSFASIRSFSENVHKNESEIDILINNAGGAYSGNKKTEDGIDMMLQVNYLGPFLLTNLLLDILKKSSPSRIINVSSVMHLMARLDLDNLEKNYCIYSDAFKYSNTKLCNVMMSNFLAERLKGSGVTSNSVHPGCVKNTDIDQNLTWYHSLTFRLLFSFIGKNVEEGAQTTIYAAVSEDLKNVTGQYFSDCKQAWFSSHARDQHLIDRLWALSENYVNLQPHEKHY